MLHEPQLGGVHLVDRRGALHLVQVTMGGGPDSAVTGSVQTRHILL